MSSLRCFHHIPARLLLRDDELTVSQVAERLGIASTVLYYWISTGKLAARHGRCSSRWPASASSSGAADRYQ
ncbi:MAG: helix-turn-helix domain-containing protein [Solirubrobacteraceae bacterium]